MIFGMRTDTAEYAYRRCGELLELFIRHRGEVIEPLPDDDVNIAEGLIRCGMVTGECSKSCVLANSVTPAGLEYLDTIKERVWWRRLLKKVGVAIIAVLCTLLGTIWQRAADFAFHALELRYPQIGKHAQGDGHAHKPCEQVSEGNATGP